MCKLREVSSNLNNKLYFYEHFEANITESNKALAVSGTIVVDLIRYTIESSSYSHAFFKALDKTYVMYLFRQFTCFLVTKFE